MKGKQFYAFIPRTPALRQRIQNVVRLAARLFLAGLLTLLCTRTVLAAPGQVLARHLPVAAAGLQPVGQLAETNVLDVAIALPLRNQPALARLLEDLYDPASPSFHQFL